MSKILVTGGCGFVGVNLIHYIQSHHPYITVTVLDNLSLGRREHLDEFDVNFVEGDIRDLDLVNRLCAGMDAIVHLAADTRVMDSIDNPDFNFDVNVIGTYNMLKAARANNVGHFVLASTGGAIIGAAEPPVHEDMVPRPMSPYGASKLMAEGYLSAFAASYGMNTVALRFSNVYGQRSWHKGSVVALIFKTLLKGDDFTVYGDGSQTRDYIYAADLCDAIIKASKLEASGEVFQLGTGKPTGLNTLLDYCRNISGLDMEIHYEDFRPGEIKDTWTDISRARAGLAFAPETSLEDGLQMTWDWFRKIHE